MVLESFLTNELDPAMLAAIEEFLDSQETGHVFQFPQWADAGSRIFVVREAGKVCWAGTFGIHPPLGRTAQWIRAATAVRGPVCDDRARWAAALEKLVEVMTGERLAYLEVSPDWVQTQEEDPAQVADAPGWGCVGQARASLRLSLVPSEEEIFANFRKASRYDVRRAEQLGVTVNAASQDADIDAFLRIHQQLGVRKGFAPDQADRTRRQIKWLIGSESRGALLLAQSGSSLCGGVVIGRSGKRAYYIWGATDREQKVNVGQVLQWKALRWAKSHGCADYDFGGYTPGATSGPAWFKAGFGGAEVHFAPARRRILAPAKYRVFRMLSRLRNSAAV